MPDGFVVHEPTWLDEYQFTACRRVRAQVGFCEAQVGVHPGGCSFHDWSEEGGEVGHEVGFEGGGGEDDEFGRWSGVV